MRVRIEIRVQGPTEPSTQWFCRDVYVDPTEDLGGDLDALVEKIDDLFPEAKLEPITATVATYPWQDDPAKSWHPSSGAV